jgi:flagellar biosynthesis chaperone FliJ
MLQREALYENFNKNSTLIVTFQAHADKMYGTTIEEFKGTLNSLASMGYDTLKINDTNDSFFFQGIDSERNSFQKTLDMLSQYMRNYERTIFMGNCAGGYAAILFGTMLNVDKVIGINTVTYMDQASLIEAGDGRESQVSFLDQSNEVLNLRNHLSKIEYKTQIYCIVDQNTSKHVKQSQNISEYKNVTIEYVDSPIPQVGFHLLRNGELINKIIGKIDPKGDGPGLEMPLEK